MQWIVDHWFELAATALLAVIAINTIDKKWNNSTIVEQLNDIIRSFSSLANRDAAAGRESSSSALGGRNEDKRRNAGPRDNGSIDLQ